MSERQPKYPAATIGQPHCAVIGGRQLWCTRPKGHDGPHAAHDVCDNVVAMWEATATPAPSDDERRAAEVLAAFKPLADVAEKVRGEMDKTRLSMSIGDLDGGWIGLYADRPGPVSGGAYVGKVEVEDLTEAEAVRFAETIRDRWNSAASDAARMAELEGEAGRLREENAELRKPQWYHDDDGEGIEPCDYADRLTGPGVFRLSGARDAGTGYFRADEDGEVTEIAKAEYEAALAPSPASVAAPAERKAKQ